MRVGKADLLHSCKTCDCNAKSLLSISLCNNTAEKERGAQMLTPVILPLYIRAHDIIVRLG